MIAQQDVILKNDIAQAVDKMAQRKERDGVKSLSRHNPKKAGKILYLFSQGVSQATMSRHYGLHHDTVKNTIKEYANHTSHWRKLGAEINSRLFLELCSIEEEMVSDLQQRLSSGELKLTFSDLLPVSVALEKAERQATRAREDVEQVSERRVVTQQMYEDTLAAAKERMKELKRLEAVAKVSF